MFVLGGPNKDRLYGQRGDDQLNAQGGRDLCHGGPGTDLAARSECERIKRAHGV